MNKAQIAITKFAGILTITGIIVNPQAVFPKTVTADTVVSSLLCTDSILYNLHQDTLLTKTYYPRMGPITIANAPDPAMGIMMPSPPGSLDDTFKVPLSGIYRAVFDTLSPPLFVTVRNPTAVTVSGLTITIFDTVRSIAVMRPNDSVTFLFPVVGWDSTLGRKVGKEITDSIDGVRLKVDSASAADWITVVFNLNGLVADEASILNQYVSFSKSFVKAFDLGDSLDIHYLDILDGLALFALTNNTDLRLNVTVSQLHLWNSSWCFNHTPPLENVGDLATETTQSDSINYYEGKNMAVLQIPPHDSIFRNVNPTSDRLFPVWIYDSADMRWKSAAPVELLITTYPEASPRIVNIKATDSVAFAIAAPHFKYGKMLATVMQNVVLESDTAKVKVPSPWNAVSKDSLGKNVWADISSSIRLPDMAFFDTMGIQYTLFSPDSPAVKAACSTNFINVSNNKLFRQQVNITDLMDLWPDSICITEKISVSVGTRMLAVNKLPVTLEDSLLYHRYIGCMNISALTTVNIYELTGVVAQGIKKTYNRFDVQYAKDKLIVSIPGTFAGPTEVSLFSLSGRCIKRAFLFGRGIIAVPFDRKIARGAYSVIVSNGNVVYKRKIFIQ